MTKLSRLLVGKGEVGRRSELPLIRQRITEAGVAGLTLRQLRADLKLSESCVRRHLAKLREEGWLVEDRAEKPTAGRPETILIDRKFR